MLCIHLKHHLVKIGFIRSHSAKIKVDVPQGSVPGTMLFNIFINDLALFDMDSEIFNFADDNTIFACGNDLNE